MPRANTGKPLDQTVGQLVTGRFADPTIDVFCRDRPPRQVIGNTGEGGSNSHCVNLLK